MISFAPGARVVIRDEEWLVRRVDPSTDGGWLLTCDGISELVRGREALFLTELEGPIEVLDPAHTKLVADTSPTYNATMLYLESMRRRSIANDEHIHLGHRGVMNLVPYQLDPALQALHQPRARILIADAVGLGKTLEAGILATELIQRGRGKRILVVTQKAMLTQFQKEWWSRFSIPLVRLDSLGLARVRNRIPANHNPFNYFDRSIISMDTLKSNLEYRNYLENAWWDIIVIDECHNVAARAGESGLSRRARLARLLSNRSDTLMLLSATPHDGSARSFASLMSLLDPTAISDPDHYTPQDFRSKGLVIRRFKKDIRDQVSADFQERITTCLRQSASAEEEAAYRALLAIRFTQGGNHKAGRQQELQRIGMQKALFSSPKAALESTQRRIALLQGRPAISDDERIEVTGLQEFQETLLTLVNDTSAKSFSRYQKLLEQLQSSEFGWNKDDAGDRLVIFSERIETLHWLKEQLTRDLKLKPKQLEVLHGSMSDIEQQALVERFGRKDDPIRVLVCSDVASEGLNLHYFCHRLVHFDLPWSLMTFQQRNGRVDRYGQQHQPHIVYLFTETVNEKIRGDLRILEILERKDEQANFNLGDPSAFLNVYDPEKEVEKVSDYMAQGATPEQVEAELDHAATNTSDNDADFLMELFGGGADTAPDTTTTAAQQSAQHTGSSTDHIDEPASLFDSDYHYAKAALTQLNKDDTLCQWQPADDTQMIALTAPRDLQERLKQLPKEVQADNDYYTLTANRERMAQAIETARQARAEEESWPQLHYLWPQHPIMEWLGDRVLTQFGRHCAPVLECLRLQPQEQAFILMGLVPNRKGQPLLVQWQVAHRVPNAQGQGAFTLQSFDDFAARAGLKAGKLPNRGLLQAGHPAMPSLQAALPAAVATMHQHMVKEQSSFAQQLSTRLQDTLAELKRLQGKQVEQLALDLEGQIETIKRGRLEQRTQQINRVFDDYRLWVQDTLTTEPQPWIQVIAAVCHPESAGA
ncbi:MULTISPECIES: DEAD/DEAH box helicase [Comamonas]|uniref:DEAD/DEAH box helicase n=1 Tax=Comamonas TaxID=283 RepID=UPI000552557B|nr:MULTISPECIES: DEAD/DEAH box helicase [Comamonas]TZG09273.1 DEAD/DEAH box helicase [Comamonas thiooxydans]UNV92703.1 DEAD/DEAH box helicase [Comamonas sp. 7D-2evo1]UNV93996.1 DEAD/DEAH box helicase [Comamonas sp. 7D-2]UNW02342.1 DEAD/DEAH box helicase [Comamonas sp. 7D-2evo2]